LRRAAVQQVEIRPDPALAGVEATVEIELTDGTRLSARCEHPRGSPENPLSRAEIEAKLRTYAPGRISAAAIDEVVRSVDRLEKVSSVRQLMDALRATRRAETRAQACGGARVGPCVSWRA
jgi:2-methylcitrate dehydratase PrpD